VIAPPSTRRSTGSGLESSGSRPTSPRSVERSGSSSVKRRRRTPNDATDTSRPPDVGASSSRGRARPAVQPSPDATSTAARALPLTRSASTLARVLAEIRALLGLERPRTRGECRAGPRPCPWIGCRYHLLIEVTPSGALQLAGAGTRGRPAALPSSAGSVVVEAWTDDAIELLEVMPYTCALDVAELGLARVVRRGRVALQPMHVVARAMLISERGARLAVTEARLSLPARWARVLE
jgi:hypothetical protein